MALFRGDDVAPSERTAQTCRSSNTLSRRQCNSESSFAGGNLHEAIARRRKYATSTAPGSAAVSHFRSNKATGLRYRSSWSGRQRLSFYYCVMVIGVLLGKSIYRVRRYTVHSNTTLSSTYSYTVTQGALEQFIIRSVSNRHSTYVLHRHIPA